MKKKIIFAYILLFLGHISFSMQEAEKVKIFTPSEVVLNIVATHYLSDHEDICSIAGTSKHYNELMLTTAEGRKCNLLKYPKIGCNIGNFVHKYGSARYYIGSFGSIGLRYYELDKKNNKFENFRHFISPLPHNPKPFFNKNGVFCFYGYGRYSAMHKQNKYCSRFVTGIWQYGIDGSINCCVGKMEKGWCNLKIFLSYPFLLKALLCCDAQNETMEIEEHKVPILLYSIDEAIIPENYRERVKFESEEELQATMVFDDFAQDIQSTIEKRYKECVEQRRCQ